MGKVLRRIRSGYLKPARLCFPDDEKVYDWLALLADAYFIVDTGVAEAIQKETKKKRTLACGKGCSSCCKTHQTIPVYPLELVGISWYVTEKVSGDDREALKNQLRTHKTDNPCPFLLNGLCMIHLVRPISCRQFNVFGKPCADNEDPYYTRLEDVLPPVKQYVDRAFFIMLPFYGVNDKLERRKVIQSGSMHKIVKLIQTCNWKTLADRMEEFDKHRPK
jgi:Fe-S-cluster containining protein